MLISQTKLRGELLPEHLNFVPVISSQTGLIPSGEKNATIAWTRTCDETGHDLCLLFLHG